MSHNGIFAIVNSGGKQYRVECNKTVEIEKLNHDVGHIFSFKNVMLVCKEGESVVFRSGDVVAQVVRHFRAKKVIVFRKSRRTSGFTRKRGHRQYLTTVFIKDIEASSEL